MRACVCVTPIHSNHIIGTLRHILSVFEPFNSRLGVSVDLTFQHDATAHDHTFVDERLFVSASVENTPSVWAA